LLTAVRDRIPVVVIVFNDGKLNLIRLQQLREFGRAYSVELRVPQFEDFARAVSVRYATAGDDFARVVREALSSTEPTLIEVPVGDSRAIAGVRAKSLTREVVRNAIGPNTVSWLKRLLG
jgi:thiamine pyrophosphate-dependent acetolactate synthase large subunit-like protein